MDCSLSHQCATCGGCLMFPCLVTANGIHPTTTAQTGGSAVTAPYCSRCVNDWPNGLHSDECNKSATWLALDLPAMRAIVRAENPDMTSAEVAIEAIRRLG